MTPLTLLLLYVAFRIKQFACDFVLQTEWIVLHKGQPGQEGYRALLLHAALHGAGTLAIALLFAPALWWLGIADIFVHGAVDRIKSVVTLRKGWNYEDRAFWLSFGLDQEAHNFTHLAYIVLIAAASGGIAAG